MKKLIFLFVVLFSSCRCLLPQISAQFVYADSVSCTAPMPDFIALLGITASDNCKLQSFTQNPAAGTVLDGKLANIYQVVIRAVDNAGNANQIQFDAILTDKVPPKIMVDTALVDVADYDKMDALLTQAERIIKDKIINADARFNYAALGINHMPDTIFYLVREIRIK